MICVGGITSLRLLWRLRLFLHTSCSDPKSRDLVGFVDKQQNKTNEQILSWKKKKLRSHLNLNLNPIAYNSSDQVSVLSDIQNFELNFGFIEFCFFEGRCH